MALVAVHGPCEGGVILVLYALLVILGACVVVAGAIFLVWLAFRDAAARGLGW